MACADPSLLSPPQLAAPLGRVFALQDGREQK